MPLQLSPEVQQVLRQAAEEAERRGHARVTTEHLLRVMVQHAETSRGLRALGLDLLRLADDLEQHLSARVKRRRWWHTPFPMQDAALRRALHQAVVHAMVAQQRALRPGDLIAALAVQPDAHAAGLLRAQGLTRLDLLRYLEHGLPRDAPALRPAGRPLPPGTYHVLLHNDHYTTMEFVSDVLRQVFGHPPEEAQRIMLHVHQHGRGLAGTYPHDLAATKAADVIELAGQAGYPLLCTVEPG